MTKALIRWETTLAIALGALLLGWSATSALAAEDPYEYNPLFSLMGNCDTSQVDSVPDPGCPAGAHPGRFNTPTSVAIDSYGNEYVAIYEEEGKKGRIDIFDDEGFFITEIPDPNGPFSIAVDEDGILYALERTGSAAAVMAKYEPTTYEPETGNIEYDTSVKPRQIVEPEGPDVGVGSIAVDVKTGHVFMTDWGVTVREYGSAAEGNVLLHTITNEKLHRTVGVAVDAERRRLYASNCRDASTSFITECGVLVFELPSIDANPSDPFSYPLLEEIYGEDTPQGQFFAEKAQNSIAVDEETGHFFVDDIQATRHIYEFGADYEYLSTIDQPFLTNVFLHQMAVSNAPLNPDAANRHFLFVPIMAPYHEVFAFNPPSECPPTVETTEVGNVGEREAELRAQIDPCGGSTQYTVEIEQAGTGIGRVVGGGTISGNQPRRVIASAAGLLPGTEYSFRVLVANGKGNDSGEGLFATYSDAEIAGDCPNQVFRVGLSASLPDCRAYELVTPADTNGRPPKGLNNGNGDAFATLAVSPSGETASFQTEGGTLPGMEGTGAFNGDSYRSTRGAGGWSTVATGPNGTEASAPSVGSASLDQGYQFWTAVGEGSAVIAEPTHYIRYPDGHSELVGQGSLGTDPDAVGRFIAENGTHIVFTSRVPLEPKAPAGSRVSVYDRTSDGVTHLVSLLPGNVTSPTDDDAVYAGVSADGSSIAFRIGTILYLRVDNNVTYEVGEDVEFAGINATGDRTFYVEDGDLFALDSSTGERIRFTSVGNATVVNVAPDGSRAYFVSTTAISGAGENPLGTLPKAGKRNLYLSHEGEVSFVGIVTPGDVEGEPADAPAIIGLGRWTSAPVRNGRLAEDPSRVNPDGSVLLFQSRADLTGYGSGGVPQVYRYDSAGNRLHCISCNPTRSVEGGATLQSFETAQGTPPPFFSYGFVPNLRADGARAFFQSEEALVSTDTDHVQDIYEWEEQGVGSCTRPGGCVYLISSGHSSKDNFLYGISATGDDVFFTTEDILVSGDESTVSIYDARVNGGFPSQIAADCVGEGCRPGIGATPHLSTPGSAVTGAKDNVRQKKVRHCPKGKRKVKRRGKVRCVKKHHKHRHHRSNKGGKK
ncbi:MAG TPA: hypothetical protein VFJ61_13460 [Solirubrobacterales bacterium]|nr:hypothetical protein [Solirubrobacterales bacterium]